MSSPLAGFRSQTVSAQGQTGESVTLGMKEAVLLKNMVNDEPPEMKSTDIATTLLARDYKGLGNYGSNGVLEW